MDIKSDKAMQTTNSFSFHRLVLLFKRSLIINKKRFAIAISAFSGILFITLVWAQASVDFSNWGKHAYLSTFISVFLSLGISYAAFSFPAFRSKEKSMTYLMLPASAAEKFAFELLSRIVAFIILMPLLFWVIANLEGALVHHYYPELINYQLSFGKSLTEATKDHEFNQVIFLIIQMVLFGFIAAFTGASHFSKSPLFKTLLTFSIIVISYILFSLFLVKAFDLLQGLSAGNKGMHFRGNTDMVIIVFKIGFTLTNLVLLAIAWFSLKEKEA